MQSTPLQFVSPFTLDDLFLFVATMDRQNVAHRTKDYRLGEMHLPGMLDHLQEEISEFDAATTANEKCEELCDVLGVVLHIAHRLRMTPLETAHITRSKLLKRFVIPGYDDSVNVPMKDCPRCNGEHEVSFHRLENPSEEFQFFAMCPATNQPIMMRAVQDDAPMSHRELLDAAAQFANSVDEITQQRDELEGRLSTLDADILSIVDMLPVEYVVRVREGGGPESPIKTLAVSISKLLQS